MRIPVFIIGPSKSGKTWVANHLADVAESLKSEYHETVGVRILEISKALSISKRDVRINLELWDCSGNPAYRSLLPGVSKDASALIYIHNNDQDDDDLLQWQSLFPHLSPSQVLIICVGKQRASKLHSWSNSLVLQFPLDEANISNLKSEFDNFLVSVYRIQQDKKDKEEDSILIGNRL